MKNSIGIVSRNAEDQIAKLRSKRKQMIANLKYENAEKIDDEIAGHHQSAIEESIQMVTNDFTDTVESYIRRSVEIDTKYVNEKEELLEENSRKFHSMFQNIQEEHLQALAVIEQRYQDNRMRENERRIPKQTHYLELSKKAAMAGDYQQALELRNRSRLKAQKDLNKRLKILEDAFDSQRMETINSQRTILLQMVSKFKEGNESIEFKTQKKLSSNNTNRELQLIAYFQKAIGKIGTILKTNQIGQYERSLSNIVYNTCDNSSVPRPNLPISSGKSISGSSKMSKASSRLPSRQSTKRNY